MQAGDLLFVEVRPMWMSGAAGLSWLSRTLACQTSIATHPTE
jgi:hypothetical protein